MSVISQFMPKLKFKSQVLTSTAGQSVFTLTTISINGSDEESALVLINGIKQPVDAYVVNTPTQITTSESLELNDTVEVVVTGY